MPNRQKGSVSPLIILAVIAAVAIGGYFFLNKGSTTGPSITTPVLTQRATEKDFESVTDDPVLKKHLASQVNKTAYRTKGTSPGSGLTTVTEVQVKGDGSINIRDIENDGPKEIKNMIMMGDTTYLKDYSDNKWWKQTVKSGEPEEEEMSDQPVDFKEEYSQPNLKFKSLGKEPCGNMTCFKYEQEFTEELQGKRIFWFDDNEYLLRKDQAGYGEFIATLEYTYDGINITEPSPTKDVPEGKSIYEYQNLNYAPSAQQNPQTQSTQFNEQDFNQQVEDNSLL